MRVDKFLLMVWSSLKTSSFDACYFVPERGPILGIFMLWLPSENSIKLKGIYKI